MTDMSFRGKVAIVTGSGGGIGKAEALLLAREGAKVVVNDIARDDGVSRASIVVDAIRQAGGEAVESPHRIGTIEAADEIVALALDSFGRLDILINNAGCCVPEQIENLTEPEWDRVVEVNLKGTFALMRAALPHMKRQRAGVIVNTASEAGLGQPMMACYSAAKEGVVALTRTVAREAGRFGIRCNCIRPRAMSEPQSEMGALFIGKMDRWQPLLDALGPYWLGELGNSISGWGTPAQVAPFVIWLCGNAAASVNGRTFLVGGDDIALFSEPQLVRIVSRKGGWDLVALTSGAAEITAGLSNDFLLSESISDRDL